MAGFVHFSNFLIPSEKYYNSQSFWITLYLYNRVMELEKRNQKLEKKVDKLKRKKKELKQEVRAKIQSQGSEEVDKMTGQDEDQDVSQMTHCYILDILKLPLDDAIFRFWIQNIQLIL